MPTDPVCYKVIDEDEAACRITHKGQEFYFCSDFCRKKFEENPGKYATGPVNGHRAGYQLLRAPGP